MLKDFPVINDLLIAVSIEDEVQSIDIGLSSEMKMGSSERTTLYSLEMLVPKKSNGSPVHFSGN